MTQGELNRRLSFYRIKSVDDGIGGSTDQEELIFTTYAKVTPISATKLLFGGQDANKNVWEIYILANNERTPLINDYIMYGNERMNIYSVQRISEGQRFYLKILAQSENKGLYIAPTEFDYDLDFDLEDEEGFDYILDFDL